MVTGFDAVLVCLPVEEHSIGSVVPGSTQERCFTCDCRVWVSVSGQKQAETTNVGFECIPCVIVKAKANPDLLKNADAVPGAVEEIVSHLRSSRP